MILVTQLRIDHDGPLHGEELIRSSQGRYMQPIIETMKGNGTEYAELYLYDTKADLTERIPVKLDGEDLVFIGVPETRKGR